MAIQQLEPREVVAPQPSAEPGWAEPSRPRRFDPVDAAVVLLLIGVVYGLAVTAARWTSTEVSSVTIDLSPTALPGYAASSLFRMTAAYILAMIFSLAYGHVAAQSKTAERIMLPILDILQSIPILSFMPGVVLGLVALFPHSNARAGARRDPTHLHQPGLEPRLWLLPVAPDDSARSGARRRRVYHLNRLAPLHPTGAAFWVDPVSSGTR